jgi:DNA-binding NtrC family response regulator
MTEPVVLIVEQDRTLRMAIAEALAQHGFRAHLAGSSEEACDILSMHRVDSVLMELRLPTMSGQTLFHIIISRWPQLRYRVVVMTGHPETESTDPWLRLYRLPVATKPVDIEALLSTINAIIADEPREVNGKP